jgi:hypothetical protein
MRRIKRIRDIGLLIAVIIYSGAHMPSSHGLARITKSFADGYARGYAGAYASAHDHQK